MGNGRAALTRASKTLGLDVALSVGLLLLAPPARNAFAEERSDLTGLRVTSIGELGPPSKRVDLVIVGDGYVADDGLTLGNHDVIIST